MSFGWAGAAAGGQDALQEMLALKRTKYLQDQAAQERQVQSARAQKQLELEAARQESDLADRQSQRKLETAKIALSQIRPGEEVAPDVASQIQGTPYAGRLETKQTLPSSTIPGFGGATQSDPGGRNFVNLKPTAEQEQAQGQEAAKRRVVDLFKRGAPRNEMLSAMADAGENIGTAALNDPAQTAAEAARVRAAEAAQEHQYRLDEIGAQGDQTRRTASAKTEPTGPSDYSLEHAQRNIEAVDTLIKKVGIGTAGFGGSVLGNIPGTPARDFAAELNTLKANIAFSELTAMREASKTGGALGAISDREETLLSSTLGALDPGQSPANLIAQLQKIRESVTRWQAAQAKYGKGPMAVNVDPNHLGHVPDQQGGGGGSSFRVVGSR